MSSLGLDPDDPLPPVDDDSELVGKNNKRGKPDPGEGGPVFRRVEAGAIPVVGGVAFPIPATFESQVDESDDEE